MSPREKQLIKIEESKEFERSLKWVEMTDNKHWNQWMKNKRNKVASRVKKGIPDSIRSRAWALLTETSKMKKKYPTTMNELLEKPAHDGYIVINKDLSRTFPQIGFFSKPGFIESLRRVLCCYCQTDPTLGYTQGMSFIAGMLLAYMDEETAYYSFVNIMLQPRINHRGYLLSGFPRLERANDMLLCLMDKKCPKVIKRMNEIGVFMQMFTPGWFLTAYQSFNWPPEFQLRIFERFLFYGTRALINFAIIIIMKHVDILEKAEIEVFLKVLQHPDESERMMNWHSVLEDWDKNWIKKKEYEYLLDRVGAQSETDHY
ncbi:TBC domain containing protein [Tritrichomonas foetus]|uniref:TBC domain containing protein n=1 Tax=Tritrichomonas foetus TaxID=1144522 RepID=A0A1J4K8U6_9EUKA|nr:TBC domain containing protein [Tritrichomonas foetus]|eukprot:OHT07362.1 TBC domain containing protein [Tritrichomonas foetus]